MIQKMKTDAYLGRYNNMSVGEQQLFKERVGEWLRTSSARVLKRAEQPEARLQNITQVSVAWNDKECESWDDGVRLLTAFASDTDTWLPDKLYIKSASRSIKQLVSYLTKVAPTQHATAAKKPQPTTPKKSEATGKAPVTSSARESGKPKSVASIDNSKTVPVRPKHIDQYVHLLPESTQKKAATVKDLMNELDTSRESLRLLMGAPQASNADREKWAKKAASIDGKLKAIFKELDAEWAKVVAAGKVVVDDLGNARVVETEGPAVPVAPAKPEPAEKAKKGAAAETVDPAGSAAKTAAAAETAAAIEKAESAGKAALTPEARKKKIVSLQTQLRDTRRGQGDKLAAYVEKWKAKYRELIALGGPSAATASIRAAADHYGIDINKI